MDHNFFLHLIECLGEYTDTSLKEMESDSQPGVLYRVSCIIKSLYIYPDEELCQKCGSGMFQIMNCFFFFLIHMSWR